MLTSGQFTLIHLWPALAHCTMTQHEKCRNRRTDPAFRVADGALPSGSSEKDHSSVGFDFLLTTDTLCQNLADPVRSACSSAGGVPVLFLQIAGGCSTWPIRSNLYDDCMDKSQNFSAHRKGIKCKQSSIPLLTGSETSWNQSCCVSTTEEQSEQQVRKLNFEQIQNFAFF